MIKPVCFMVMPFGTKSVEPPQAGHPTKIDFNALWDRALKEAIAQCGYEPVRADQDLGALIILEMLERLTWADLVVADLTLPNPNVYYEIGVRHAAQKSGCVLVSADWAKPAFDLDQIRRVTYPLPEGEILPATAKKIQEVIQDNLPEKAKGESPVWQVQGYNANVDGDPPKSFRELVRRLSKFQSLVQEVWAAAPSQRADRALELYAQIKQEGGEIVPAAALEMLYLIRDTVHWEETLQYIEGLPSKLKELPVVREQKALALAKVGDPLVAVGEINQLIQEHGDTSERSGLLGGRFKVLADEATTARDKTHYLEKAIDAYRRGADLDLNEYYCAGNLAQLYRERGGPDDEALARKAARRTLEACWRARRLGLGDKWLNATILGACVDARDLDQAKAQVHEVIKDPAPWEIETTLKDLRRRVGQIKDDALRSGFEAIVEELSALDLPPAST